MAVISMKRVLGEGHHAAAYGQGASDGLRVAQILIRGIGLHAVEGDPGESRAFRTAMDQFADSIAEAVTEAAALATASDALRALERYNRSAENYLHAGRNDLRAMVTRLAEESVTNLREIESSIASASQSQDVGAVRMQLANCLMEIRKEAERRKATARSVVNRLHEESSTQMLTRVG